MSRGAGAGRIAMARVFPIEGTNRVAPGDRRVQAVRRLDLPMDLPSFPSLAAWEARATDLRRHILLCSGLWPLPERGPLRTSRFGRIERADYAVEKVYFESLPGFYVTGNLYSPLVRRGPFPGVLNPHGHWHPRGRLTHDAVASIPARCISFARQGYLALSYDMVGYVDSTQVPHTFGGPREELWGLSLLGLQLWNSLRAVDFLLALPDIDPDRLGCTGESGGGTQALLLTAVDDRIAAAAPVNMVSAHMQGGCLCENAPHLRLDTSNVEIAALAAPRPLLLVSATGDWTRDTPSVEYPAVRSIYQLFGSEERVACVRVDAPHNYNLPSRNAVYAFFGRWLLGAGADAQDLRERPLTVEDDPALRVFAGADWPVGALDGPGLTRLWIRRAEDDLIRAWPRVPTDQQAFRARYLPALQHAVAARWPETVDAEVVGTAEGEALSVERLLVGRPGCGDQLPALFVRPRGWEGAHAALVVHGAGKAALFDDDAATPGPLVRGLLSRRYAVLAVDAFLTGEYHTVWGRAGRDQGVPFFTTYNRTDAALRVQDVLTAFRYLRVRARGGTALVGCGDAGMWCLLARALMPAPPTVVADAARFARSIDASYLERCAIPSLRRAGDFRVALALAAPAPAFIHNAAGVFAVDEVIALYQELRASGALQVRSDEADVLAILSWLPSMGHG